MSHHTTRPSTTSVTSVSATNSPLLSPRHPPHAGDSLRSISSDESTAAVVSLPVTTPLRQSEPSENFYRTDDNAFPKASSSPGSPQRSSFPISYPSDGFYPHRGASSSPGSPLRSFAPPLRAGCSPDPSYPPPMRPSSSLLSLAKPALIEPKRPSILSGNAITVNIHARSGGPKLGKTVASQVASTIPPAVEDEEDKAEDCSEGVKVPTPSSGVLQVSLFFSIISILSL